MKKFKLIIIALMIVVVLGSCSTESYDDLYQVYTTHLDDQREIYDTYISDVNRLSSEGLKAVVFIEAHFYSQGIKNTGSGAIIKSDAFYDYVLTNHHVTTYQDNQPDRIFVRNYLNEEVEGDILFSDATYDLCLLRIEKGSELDVFKINLNEVTDTTILINIGYPEGQNHAISMGYFVEYNQISVNDMSSSVNLVTFDVLISSVPVKSGSSGSALLNQDLEVVGLVYAARFTDDDLSVYAYAIPSEKIVEFLMLNEFEVATNE